MASLTHSIRAVFEGFSEVSIFSFTDTTTGLLGLLPDVKGAAPNCALAFTTAGLQAIRDCGVDPNNCFRTDDLSTVTLKLIDFGIGCASSFTGPLKPVADAAVALKSLLDSGLAYRTFRDCRINNPRAAATHAPQPSAVARRNPFLLQYELEVRLGAFMDHLYGPGWRFIRMAEMPLLAGLLEGLRDAVGEASPGGQALTAAERDALLALPRPESRTEADVAALIARFETILPGGDPASFDLAGLEAKAADLEAVLQDLVAEDWGHTHEGYARGLAILQELIAEAGQRPVAGAATARGPRPAADAPLIPGLPDRPHAWWLLDLNTGFFRRGTLNAAGRFEGLILAPNTAYLVGYADPLTGRAGVNHFRSAGAGQRTLLPGAVMAGPPAAPDADHDGLSDLAELILGTNPANPDTDGDGVRDGAEFFAGENPLSGLETVIGVIGSADTPGEARDLAIEGDLAVVLDGDAGLALFDLADPRAPVRVTQFALASPVSVALSGGLALVGQNNGATLLDVRSPASPLVLTNFPGTAAHAVALASPYGYVSRGTNVLTVDLATGALLPPLGLPAAVDEFAVDGDLLHVLTRQALHVFRRNGSELAELSRTAVAGNPAPFKAGRKLFAGGGRAYVGYFQGFTILSVTNPATPVVLATQPATQAAIHDFADNGSGLLAAITSFGGEQSLAFSLYDVAAGTTVTNFLASVATPGDPFAVVLHRGLAYVADDEAGLQVINYLPRDTAGQRPAIAFGPPLSVAPVLEAGSSPLLTFATGDDVAVREVELFADGLQVGAAGAFPFQIPVTVAPPAPGRTSVVLRARAVDTAGNERWTDELTVSVTPDQTPPLVRLLSPPAGAKLLQLASVQAGFSEPMDPATLAAGLRVTEAGPDGTLGTADDVAVAVTASYEAFTRTVRLRREPAFAAGRYRLTATTDLRDASGLAPAAARSWDFRVLAPAVAATTPANNSNHRPGAPAQVTARFSTLMDAASLRAGGFLLDHAGPDGTAGTADDVPVDVAALTFSAMSNRMVFTPAPPLRSGRYSARLTTNALDVVGSRLTPGVTWSFTVLSPAVAAVDPPDGHARPLGGLAAVRVRFTEALDPATLADGLRLELTNGTPVTGGVTAFDPDTLTATLAFAAALPGGEYRLRVTTNVTDIYGNPLAAEFTSRFGVHGPVTWAVDADGRWDGAANWSPARPVPGDDVVLDRPTANVVVTHQTGSSLVGTLAGTESLRLTGGSLTLLSNSVFGGPLLVQGGTLSNRADLRLTGPVTFGPRGRLRGGGTAVFAGPVNLAGSTAVGGNAAEFGGQTLLVEGGPLTWAAGDVTGDSGPEAFNRWVVGPAATFEAVAGTSQRDWQGYDSTLWNRGLFRQTGGTNRLRWQIQAVTNDAVWEIQAGHAELQGSLVQAGRLALAAGTSLALTGNDGVLQLAPGGVIEGPGAFSARRKTTTLAGRFAVTGGATFESLTATVTGELAPGAGGLRFVNADVVFDGGPLTLASPLTLREGTLDFRHPATLGDFRWEFGDLRPTADVTVTNRVVIGAADVGNGSRIVGPGRLRFADGFEQRSSYFDLGTNVVLEHAGATIWQPRVVRATTTLSFNPGAVFRNLANGRFELATNGTVSGRGTFENLGTLVKAANALTNVINVALESPGPLEVAGGLLQLGGGGTLGGPVEVSADATLEITGAGQRSGWRLTGEFIGGGRLRLLGGSNHLAGTFAGPALFIQGQDIRLAAGLSLTNVEVRGGTLHLDGPLRLAGTNTVLTGSNTRVRGAGPVRNDGRVTESVVWFDADLENAGEWIYTGTTRQRYGGQFHNLPGATYTIATNLTGSLPSGPAPGVFDNAGLLRKLGPGNARVDFALTNRGVIEVAGALTVGGAFTQTDAGLLRLGGGTFSPAGTGRVLAGEIHGPGTVGRGGSGAFYAITNTAHLRPGGPAGHGVLEFDATAAHLRPDSLVTLRIGGSAAGTEHDQLRSNGSLWLGGRLRLEFTPGFAAAGQKFLIVSAGSRLQTFRSDFEVAGLPAGLAVRLNYLPAGVEAEVIAGP